MFVAVRYELLDAVQQARWAGFQSRVEREGPNVAEDLGEGLS